MIDYLKNNCNRIEYYFKWLVGILLFFVIWFVPPYLISNGDYWEWWRSYTTTLLISASFAVFIIVISFWFVGELSLCKRKK